MDLPSFTDLDDDLFPFCTAETVGALHTDEFGAVWVSLGPDTGPGPGPR